MLVLAWDIVSNVTNLPERKNIVIATRSTMPQGTNKDFNNKIEYSTIQTYVSTLEQSSGHTFIIEAPITSIPQNKLSRGESMPDGLIIDIENGQKSLIETTLFSHSPEEVEKICKLSKHPDKFKEIMAGSWGIRRSLDQALYETLTRKLIKKYKQAAQLSGASKIVLIVKLINMGPYLSESLHDFLNRARNLHILFDWKIDMSDFTQICFMYYGANNEIICEIIVDAQIINRLRERRLKQTTIKESLSCD